MPHTSTSELYSTMENDKSVIVERVERYAGWTLPSIFPIQGTNASTELQHDVQSFGAKAVNHLSNKLMIGLFSPARSFFRLDVADAMKEKLAASGMEETEMQKSLQKAEKEANKELDRAGAREPFTMLLQLLIVAGDALLYMPEDDKIQVYNLRDYVVARDITGRYVRVIVKDSKKFQFLPKDIREELTAKKGTTFDDDHDIDLFTDIRWDSDRDKYLIDQYAEDIKVSKVQGIYTEDTCPYIPLAWKLVRGENYGRGLVEDYSGDFHSLSTGETAILELFGIISQIKGLVDPAGLTDVNELNGAANGQWCSGREQDIGLLSFDKVGDLQAIDSINTRKEQRLSQAFLMDSAGIRDAERVTAEEVRVVARDLEMALGGVYTRLAQTFQLPVAKLLLRRINFKLGNNMVEPIITTGLDALSRSGDMDSYRAFIQDANLLGAVDEGVRAEIAIERLLIHIATSHGLEHDIAFKTKEEKQAEAAQREAQERQAVNQQVEVDAAKETSKAVAQEQ